MYTHIFKAFGFGFFALGIASFSALEICRFVSKYKKTSTKPLIEPEIRAEDAYKYIL